MVGTVGGAVDTGATAHSSLTQEMGSDVMGQSPSGAEWFSGTGEHVIWLWIAWRDRGAGRLGERKRLFAIHYMTGKLSGAPSR